MFSKDLNVNISGRLNLSLTLLLKRKGTDSTNSLTGKRLRKEPSWPNKTTFISSSKIRLMRSLVTSIFLYACESWTLTAELQRRIQSMEKRCYRKILHISYKDHVTNEEVCAKIQRAIGSHEDLLTTVKRRKLQWYGHVCRSSGLVKTIFTVKGGRRQDRQRKRWEDNTRKWTGVEFVKSQRSVENRKKWRTQVAKSSVVPQRPSQWRDRWDNEMMMTTIIHEDSFSQCPAVWYCGRRN